MKLITGNRLKDGHVIYVAAGGGLTTSIDLALPLEDAAAGAMLEGAAADRPALVNPYLIEIEHGRPSGRDRMKESIRAAGPTVGHSLDVR